MQFHTMLRNKSDFSPPLEYQQDRKANVLTKLSQLQSKSKVYYIGHMSK